MAVYKVPQDVEAEDKLLGPFSFKQFVFLLIAVGGLGMAYALATVVLPLGLIPLPIAIFFFVMALPLRKDQPMEVYMAAVVSFLLKPKQRLWAPDGVEYLVEVTTPKVEEKVYGKGYDQAEVQRRLSYLANLVDSRGWSVRGVNNPNSSMRAEVYNEAQVADDLLDDNSATAKQISNLIDQSDRKRRQDMVARMHQSNTPDTSPTHVSVPTEQPTAAPIDPAPAVPQQPIQPQSILPDIPAATANGPSLPAPITAAMQPANAAVVAPTVSSDTALQAAAEAAKEEIDSPNLTYTPYPTMRQSVIMPINDPQTPHLPSQPSPSPTKTQTSSATTVDPAIMDLANNRHDLSIEDIQREANRIHKKKDLEEEVVISLH